MKGVDQNGLPVTIYRREARRPVPPGPLKQWQAIDLRQRLARALASQGYTAGQIAQVLRCGVRTVGRDLAEPSPLF